MIDSILAQLGLTLRLARNEDKEMLFQWRNMDEIVALGSTQRCVTWEEHSLWFDQALRGKLITLFLVEANEVPIGLVRFDAKGKHGCIISTYLIPGETGKGRGVVIIQEACIRAVTAWRHLQWVEANIRYDNLRSVKAFKRAGFIPSTEQSRELPDDHVSPRWCP